MKKALLTIAIVLVAAGCNQQAQVKNQQPSQTASTDQTTSWNTYSNRKYGFEVKLNSDWHVKYYHFQDGEGTKEVAPDEANIIGIDGDTCSGCTIDVRESSKITIDQRLKEYQHIVTKKQIIIDGLPAYDLITELPGIYERDIVFVKDNGNGRSNIFTIFKQFNDQPVNVPEFDQLVSSFKFTK